MKDEPRPIFDIRPDTHVSALWYAQGVGWYAQGVGGDVLMLAFRHASDRIPRIVYRFRWYRDDKHHDSADRKTVYELAGPPESDDAKLIEDACMVIRGLVAIGFCGAKDITRVDVNGGQEALMRAMEAMPQTQLKVVRLDGKPNGQA